MGAGNFAPELLGFLDCKDCRMMLGLGLDAEAFKIGKEIIRSRGHWFHLDRQKNLGSTGF